MEIAQWGSQTHSNFSMLASWWTVVLSTDVKIFYGFVRDENKWLRSERDEWEVRARNSIDRLYCFRKENEHQVIARESKFEVRLCNLQWYFDDFNIVFSIFSFLFWSMKMNWCQMLRSKQLKWLVVYLGG